MVNGFSKFTALIWGPVLEQTSQDSGRPEDSILNSLVDDYVIVRKKDISGISGYLCERCWSFEFRYIKDIGFDLTAGEAHRCGPTMLRGLQTGLENRRQIQNELIKQKNDCLLNLTNSVFPEDKFLVVDSKRVNEGNYHVGTLRLDQITPEHWAWKPLLKKSIELSQYDLRKFLAYMAGTYGRIVIESGQFSGSHLMYIT
jgi:hypothetical protein